MPLKDRDARRAYLREYQRKWYKIHRLLHRGRCEAWAKRERSKVDTLLAKFRSNGCLLCCERDSSCLDAHHVDPSTKELNIGEAVGGTYSYKRVEVELEKCVCLCSNCHRKLHAGVLSLPPAYEVDETGILSLW